MADLGWSRYADAQEKVSEGQWLDSLHVQKTQSEEGDRYMIADYDSNWVGESYDAEELALEEIKRMQDEHDVSELERMLHG